MKSNLLLRPLACAFLCLSFIPLRPAAAAPALTLSQLLARHRNAELTPEAQKHKTAREIVYDLSMGSLTGTMTSFTAPPNKSRDEMRLGPVVNISGTDGKASWEQDGSGHVRLLSGEELRESVADAEFSLEDFDPLTDKTGAVVTLRPGMDPKTGCYVLDAKPKNGSPHTYYLNPKTYLIQKEATDSAGSLLTNSVLEYQQIEGAEIPSRMALQIAGVPLIVNATLKSASRLLAGTAPLFSPPAAAKDWQFLASDAPVSASLPFKTENNEVVVPVTVNGHTLRLLLDSGAGQTFITAAAAQAAGLTVQDGLPSMTAGGPIAEGQTADTTLDIGNAVRLSHITLGVVKATASGDIDGSLGYDIFARLLVRMDYSRQTLTLSDPDAASTARSAATIVVPIKMEDDLPTVAAFLDSRFSGRFIVDTGGGGAVFLNTAFAAANHFLPKLNDPDVKTQTGYGVGTQFTEVSSPGHTLRVGAAQVSNLNLETVIGQDRQSTSQAGIIGNLFLNHFVVTFDYIHGLLYLTPAPAAVSRAGAWRGPSIAASVRPAPALTLSQLLARHRAASATPAALKDKSGHAIVYDISAGGLSGTMTTYEAPPHRSRMEMRMGPLNTTTGTDGKTTWEQDGTGNVRILGGEELAERSADEGFSLEDFDLSQKTQTATVTLRPGIDPATRCYVLDVKPKNGTAQTIYLDAKTYLVQKIVQHKGGLTGTTTMLGYVLRDGTEVPSRLSIQYAGLPLTIDATLKSVSKLPGVTAAFFAPPDPDKDWRFLAPGPRTAASLPFENFNNEIVFPATINGHPLRMLLDSGSATAFVTASAALAAGLTTEGSLPALGYGGSAATGLVPNATVDVGDAVELSRLTLHVIKDPALAKLLEERGHVDGAIGYELFARLLVGIDYAGKTLTLTDPAVPAASTAGSLIVPIKLENRMPTILASVDQKAPGRFLVDTGDSGAAHIYTQYAEANHLVPRPTDPGVATRQSVGVGGQITETLSPGHSLSVSSPLGGSATLSGLPLSTMTGPGIAQVSSQAGGIGNLFWNHFTVTFDYARGKMFLRPNPVQAPLVPAAPAVKRVSQNAPQPPMMGEQEEHFSAGFTHNWGLGVPIWNWALGGPGSFPNLGRTHWTLTANQPAPLTLETLLQKHLAALGGAAALEAIHNTQITTQVKTGGITGTVFTIYAAPDKEYEEDKLGILDNLQGYDGKEAWERDTNGNVRDLAGEELKDLRIQLFFDTNSYVLPGRMPGEMTLRPQTEAGTGNFVVDAYPEGAKKTTLFFDPNTFMIVKEQHLDDDVLMTTEYSDYRTIDGTPFPFHTVTTNGATRYDIVGQVIKIQNNVPLPPGIFAKPSGGKNFGFIQPGAKAATVPFDMDDGEIGLKVKINGTPERVFLDSGAAGIALAQSAADALGLKSSGFLEVRGYGGSTDQHPVLIQKLEVPGAVQLSSIAAIAIDLPEQLNSYFTRPVAGFIGYDLLSHFVVRVDYPHRKLTFIQAEAFHPTPADGHALPVGLDSSVPTIEAHLDALPPSRFLLDTGDADAAVRLYGPYVASNNLDKKYPHGEIAVGGGVGGVSRSRRTRISTFTVAGYTFPNLPADFSLDTKGGASLVNAGSLGSRLLSRFILTFDYPHSRVFFVPVPGTLSAFETRTTGVSLMETKDSTGRVHLAVAEVLPGAPAAKAGLQEFDEVLAIDGKPAGQIGLTGARRMLSASSGPAHKLLVQSAVGKPRTVTAGLFDPLQ